MPSTFENAVSRMLGEAQELRPLTLRFRDQGSESAFQRDYFANSLGLIRLAHVFGIVGWVVLGVLAQTILSGGDAARDALIRVIAISLTSLSLIFTYRRWFEARWQTFVSLVVLTNGLLWCVQQVVVNDHRADWGYAGLMLILAFCFILSRLQVVHATVVGVALICAYNLSALVWGNVRTIDLVFADYFLLVFGLVGLAAAYGLERSGRVLFLRERQLELERNRADDLLRNTLPDSIVGRLKDRDPAAHHGYLADAHPAVTVLFADIVGFTQRSSGIPPKEIVSILDTIFSDFDALADRLGLEKIKTVGDAYMAVAGVPDARADHAEAAAEMGLGILDALRATTWPDGEPIVVRVGIASGPAVAAVIGRRKFAYDVWGDTVNLASRLEAIGEPGRIQVSDSTYELIRHRFDFDDPRVLDLKGRGSTPARFLVSRRVATGSETGAREFARESDSDQHPARR
jgi:class 3 adenylate cyclase